MGLMLALLGYLLNDVRGMVGVRRYIGGDGGGGTGMRG